MTKYVINGGKTLNGEVTISGAKNAAVAIVPAALLADGPVRLENVPKIIDVTLQMEIMRELGAQIRLINSTTVEIQNTQNPSLKPHELERKLRASYYLLGVLLGKYGFAEVAMPGGCNFGGVRPIDQHIKGFEALGAKVTLPKGGYIRVEAPEDGLHGAHIYFDVVTVGATMNIMLAAVLAKGQTIMENCAKEPHIVDLANFLNAMGADVKGAGTDVIKIRGVESLHGGSYSIIPDQIEAGTFMAAVAACGGSVLVKNVIPRHLECITAKLREMSVEVTEFDDAVLVRREGRLTKTNIKTLPYPGFPTDMQPQMTTALCLAEGTSIITEGIWGSRYRYTEELTRSLPRPAPRQLTLPDEEQKQHMLSLRNLLAAILVLLAILILLMLWGMVSQGLHTATPPAASSSVSAPESTVLEEPVTLAPNFVGMDYDAQVRNNHNYVGDYLFYVTLEYSDTVEKGKIIRQEPEAGDVIEKGGTVSLVVSKGPQLVQMPDVIGFTQEGAVSELESRGLTPSCFMVVNDGSYAAGCVVSCSVDAGTSVEVGSVITVYIAADPSVEITAEPPAASDSDSASSASSGETPADDT